jgi:hypothetical protein
MLLFLKPLVPEGTKKTRGHRLYSKSMTQQTTSNAVYLFPQDIISELKWELNPV